MWPPASAAPRTPVASGTLLSSGPQFPHLPGVLCLWDRSLGKPGRWGRALAPGFSFSLLWLSGLGPILSFFLAPTLYPGARARPS